MPAFGKCLRCGVIFLTSDAFLLHPCVQHPFAGHVPVPSTVERETTPAAPASARSVSTLTTRRARGITT